MWPNTLWRFLLQVHDHDLRYGTQARAFHARMAFAETKKCPMMFCTYSSLQSAQPNNVCVNDIPEVHPTIVKRPQKQHQPDRRMTSIPPTYIPYD
ncbi:hypothetical protein M5689_023502 [Euphorbia peplus]|nr:hypothetical protein M5689_023502 [Euphorbia peplus]